MRRRLSRRMQADPRLIEERTLGIVNVGVIEAGPEGLDSENRFHCWSWQTVEKIEEEKQYIVLCSKLGETIFLPKACTGGPAATQAVMETMTGFWHSAKTGAPLPAPDGVWPPSPYRWDAQASSETPEQ